MQTNPGELIAEGRDIWTLVRRGTSLVINQNFFRIESQQEIEEMDNFRVIIDKRNTFTYKISVICSVRN